MSLLVLLVILTLFVGIRALLTLIGWLATLVSLAIIIFLLNVLASWWLKT